MSIQQEIETALHTMTRQKVKLLGSGRTDAGVHALGQVANFTCDTAITPEAFHKGLNSILPDDIVIRHITQVPLDFHARFNAKSKYYRYQILNRPVPSAIERHYTWWIRSPLDLSAMTAAAGHIIGRHDFKAFEGAGSPRSHTDRHIMEAKFKGQTPGRLSFDVRADGFLRYMVRNLVGTLVDVGLGKMPPDHMKHILNSKDRTQASATAPARGLFLIEVDYTATSRSPGNPHSFING
jgi:tRNA pseudouridine38-40 synthase